MPCPACKRKVPENAKRCPYCGNPIKGEHPWDRGTSEPKEPKPVQPEKKKIKIFGLVIFWIIALFCVLIASNAAPEMVSLKKSVYVGAVCFFLAGIFSTFAQKSAKK